MTADTAALRALADAATPGPWSVSTLSPHIIYSETDCRPVAVVVNGETPWFNEADAELIAALHPATVRALCDAADEVERLRGAVVERDTRLAETIRYHDARVNRADEATDASRTAHAGLVADLRAKVAEWTPDSTLPPAPPSDRDAGLNAAAHGLAALLDRHAPTTGATP